MSLLDDFMRPECQGTTKEWRSLQFSHSDKVKVVCVKKNIYDHVR